MVDIALEGLDEARCLHRRKLNLVVLKRLENLLCGSASNYNISFKWRQTTNADENQTEDLYSCIRILYNMYVLVEY